MSLNELVKDWRLILLFICLAIAFFAISPNPAASGVIGDSGEFANLKILSINGVALKSVSDFEGVASNITEGQMVSIVTEKGSSTRIADKNQTLGFTVKGTPFSRLQLGLDLQGGTSAVIKPEIMNGSNGTIDSIVNILNTRLNSYGLKSVEVKEVADWQGKYIQIDMAGSTPDDVKEILTKQGKFEAKLANQTVFTGNQIIKVYTDTQNARVIENGYEMRVQISQEAANKFYEIAKSLPLSADGQYLSEKIEFYLDDKLVDSLNVAKEFREQVISTPTLTGKAGSHEEALKNFKEMQTVLLSGALPIKLEIVSMNTISPSLGAEFLAEIIKAGLCAILAVGSFIFIRYRLLKVSLPIMFIMLCEIFMTLGAASLINWQLDLAAMAGIIAAVGTGVNDQIVITDEALNLRKDENKRKTKNARFIIVAAALTVVAAMIPLTWGLGTLMGFAITTIIGVSIGVLVTRPAYVKILEHTLGR